MNMPDKTALFWESAKSGVRCVLCPHECLIADGKYGICKARKNENGKLVSKSYGAVSAINLDPVEKKPLYHFYPGSKTLSFGSYGCNLSCGFCQNYSISAANPCVPEAYLSAQDALYFALEKNIRLISYTYNEPLTDYEWVLETAELARKKGMKNILVTNGYINEKPLIKLCGFIDAANVDLKAFSGRFYKNCGGSLAPVLKTIEIMFSKKVHLELTNLVIEGENTAESEFKKMIDFISGLSDEMPLHLSRYFPAYKFTKEQTSSETLKKLYETAKKRLKYAYIGNYDGSEY
ncbi:MAG: AmmeMemoRadiSam system radical SAM enzyme, partial [Endomicrobia bacterium]|nr:AmmeMemoRadiSam system radical SAM enzyme [Endomicrobiia bacterium]